MSILRQRLGVRLPIVQAPMAGVSTPSLAAAVSNAGGLGSLAIGASTLSAAREAIRQTRSLTDAPFAVNVFCNAPARKDGERERRWLAFLQDEFARVGARPPDEIQTIYGTFVEDREVAQMLVDERVPAVSFHFGLPKQEIVDLLKRAGALLLATATSVPEARLAQKAGVDVLVAQGWEAGGHRGVFDPLTPDERLSIAALLSQLRDAARKGAGPDLPIIAAGGLMDGRDIAAVLAQGAIAAQLGTAFVACPELAADEAYRRALAGAGRGTEMVDVVSGRPARTLANDWVGVAARAREHGVAPPDYPRAYDAGKALGRAARAQGGHGFDVQWAGDGVARARAMPAGELVALLAREMDEA